MCASFLDLPDEVVEHILVLSDSASTVCAVARTTRALHSITQHESLWMSLVLRRWPQPGATDDTYTWQQQYARRYRRGHWDKGELRTVVVGTFSVLGMRARLAGDLVLAVALCLLSVLTVRPIALAVVAST
jgi:hypothetical protein